VKLNLKPMNKEERFQLPGLTSPWQQLAEALPSLIFAIIWVGQTLWLVVQLLAGRTAQFAARGPRFAVLGWMILFGWLYYNIEKTKFKLVIGVVEILAGLAGNYAQLGALAKQGGQGAIYDRMALFIGGVVVLSKGVKDVMKGLEKFGLPDEQKTDSKANSFDRSE
jgi:hypothetical protein